MSYRVRVESVSWVEAMPLLRLARAWAVALRFEMWATAYVALLVHVVSVALIGFLIVGRETLPGADGHILNALKHLLVPIRFFDDHVWAWVIWGVVCYLNKAFFGGVLCRLAAQRWGRVEKQGIGVAVGVVARRFAWYTITPVLPVALAGLLVIPLVLAGWMLRVPLLDWVGVVLAGPALLLALFAAVILAGLALAGPLFYPSLSVEVTDGYDTLSRVYAFGLGRPVSYLGAVLLLVVFGAVGGGLLMVLLGSGLWGAVWLLSYFSGLPPEYLISGESSTAASEWLWYWVFGVLLLLPAALCAYVYAGLTWVYLTLRQLYDGTPVSDVAPASGPAAPAAHVSLAGEGGSGAG
ncbi:MAG: hypothetical protein RIG82_03890 [Phycisphaeraceae bacterium]